MPPRRPLPNEAESARILAAARTKPPRRAPPAAGSALGKLIKALDERYATGPRVLHARWREIMGETLARRTEPVRVVKARGPHGAGVLEVRVDGAAAALVQHQSAELLQRANLVLGSDTVSKLRIVQGPVRAGAGRAQTSVARGSSGRRRPAPPLDAAAEAELAQALETAPDGPLKAALAALGRAVRQPAR